MADQFPRNPNFLLFEEEHPTGIQFSSPLPRIRHIFHPNTQSDGKGARGLSSQSRSISKFDENPNELTLNFDIFGNALKDNGEFSLVSTTHSSHKISDELFGSSRKLGEISVFKFSHDDDDIEEEVEAEEEESEWDIDKENVDPVGNLITPSKPKRLPTAGLSSRSSRLNNSARSPLQDITPPFGTKKSPIDAFKIEVN